MDNPYNDFYRNKTPTQDAERLTKIYGLIPEGQRKKFKKYKRPKSFQGTSRGGFRELLTKNPQSILAPPPKPPKPQPPDAGYVLPPPVPPDAGYMLPPAPEGAPDLPALEFELEQEPKRDFPPHTRPPYTRSILDNPDISPRVPPLTNVPTSPRGKTQIPQWMPQGAEEAPALPDFELQPSPPSPLTDPIKQPHTRGILENQNTPTTNVPLLAASNTANLPTQLGKLRSTPARQGNYFETGDATHFQTAPGSELMDRLITPQSPSAYSGFRVPGLTPPALLNQPAFANNTAQQTNPAINPLQRETGFNAASLPKGPFGGRLGYLIAAQSLIPHAAQMQARRRNLKQQQANSLLRSQIAKDRRKAFESERDYQLRRQGMQRKTFESDRDYQARLKNTKRSTFESDRDYKARLQKAKRSTFESDRDYQARLQKAKRSTFESDRDYQAKLNEPIIKMQDTYDAEGKPIQKPIDAAQQLRKQKYAFAQQLKAQIGKGLTREQVVERLRAAGY